MSDSYLDGLPQRSPRELALAARQRSASDTVILAWEEAFWQAVQPLRNDAGWQFLQGYVLAHGDWSALLAIKPSWPALRLLDRWHPSDLSAILVTADTIPGRPTSVPGSNPFHGAMAEYPLLAMLAQEHRANGRESLQVAKALLLLAVMRGSLLATADLVRECADGIRKCLSEARWWNLVAWQTLDASADLATTLDVARSLVQPALKRELEKGPSVYSSFLGTFARVLEGLGSGAQRLPGSVVVEWAPEVDEDGGTRPCRQVLLFDAQSDGAATTWRETPAASADAVSDAGEADLLLGMAGSDDRSPQLGGETDAQEVFRANATGFRAAITNQYLTLDHDQLLPYELRALVAALKADLVGPSAKDARCAALLSLSLLTGETLRSLVQTRVEPTVRPGLRRDGSWIRVVRPEPNARTPDADQRKVLATHVDRFCLSMPLDLESWFSRALRSAPAGVLLADALGTPPDVLVEEAHRWLARLREKHPRLLAGKLARWLATALYASSHDAVAVHLLTAVESDPPLSGAYYRSPAAARLQQLHRRVIATAWQGQLSSPASEAARVGSWWYLTPRDLRRIYRAARKALLARIRDRSRSLSQRHRSHQTLSILNLLLSTGGRPVEDFGDSLELFDLRSRIAILDDKSGGPARGHRVIPLCDVAHGQIQAQCRHLRALISEVHSVAPSTARAILSILDHPQRRVAPLFFELDEKLRIRPLTPTALRDELEGLWPLPLNVARHWLSTALTELGASDDVVASFLGHVAIGTQNLSSIGLQAVESHYASLRPLLNAAIADVGVEPVEGWLGEPADPAATAGLTAMVRPLFVFGHERRSAERAREQAAIDREVDAFLSTALRGVEVKGLGQAGVDLLFAQLHKQTSNASSYHAVRLRRALRDRLGLVAKKHQTGWNLPSVEVEIADFGIRVDMASLAAAPRAARLRQSLAKELQADAASAPGRARTGVLALALAAEALVLDARVLEAWALRPEHDLVCIPAGEDLSSSQWWIRLGADASGARQFALPEWLAGILARHDVRWPTVEADQLRAQVARFAEKYGLDWMAAGLQPAIDTLRAAATLRLSGLAHSFATGEHGSVSLPRQAIERLVCGAPRTDTLEQLNAVPTEAFESETEGVAPNHDAPHTAISSTLDGVAAFRSMISGCFAEAWQRSIGKDAAMAHSRTRVDALGRLVHARFVALQAKVAMPRICGYLAQWLCAMCRRGRLKGGLYSMRTLETYWSAIAARLIEAVDIEDLAAMDPVEIEEIYVGIVEYAETEQLQHLEVALRVFHGYLRIRHGVPPIDWRVIRAMARGLPARVDANVISEDEYLDALSILSHDVAVEARRRMMQSAILVLCYRAGLRIGEAMGLRRKDINCVEGVWFVRVTGNLYRRLKSDASMRIVPLLEPLKAQEHKALQDWVRHADLYHDGRDTTALFTRSGGGRSMMPRGRVAARLREALQAATRDPRIRVHHCRHGLPNRLLSVALGVATEWNRHLRGLMGEWSDPQALLGALTRETRPTRRLIWAIANILGHSPRTLLRSYWHAGAELLAKELRAAWWPEVPAFGDWQTPALPGLHALRWQARAPGARDLGEESHRPLTPEAVDDVLELLRVHGRADGVAAATMVREADIQAVARVAADLTRRVRGDHAMEKGWWLVDPQARYEPAQVRQTREALSRLHHSLDQDSIRCLASLGKQIDEKQHMLMCSSMPMLLAHARLLRALVDDVGQVEVVLPAAAWRTAAPGSVASAGPSEPSRQGRPGKGAGAAPLAVDDVAWTGWLSLIRREGLSYTMRTHLATSKSGGANRTVRQLRVGVRIRQNTTDRVRDARVGMRVVLAAAVWSRVGRKGAGTSGAAVLPPTREAED